MRFNRIFLLFVLSAILLLGSCGGKSGENIALSPQKEDLDAASDTLDGEVSEGFVSEVVFVGDSTTAHMASRAKVSQTQVWATKSRYLNLGPRVTDEKIILPETGEMLTIAEAVARTKPRYLMVTLGIDYGVYYYRNEGAKFAFYYEKLLDGIESASPDTILVLGSIFPVGRESTAITNEMVDAANRIVADIAQKRGLVYLDSNALLKDEAGFLAEEFCSSKDGIHLTEKAYAVILENLAKHEEEIKGCAKK